MQSALQGVVRLLVCFTGLWACGRAGVEPRVWAVETLEPRLPMAGVPGLIPVGDQPAGALAGKIVYTSAGHGWQWNSNLNRWATDRGNLLSVVEDLGNQDQLTYYADHLLRAGATVVPMRPVGRQANEVVLDNDSPGVTFSGTWSNNTAGPRWYDEDYGSSLDAVKYRFASVNSTNETALATYTPGIPQAGFYPVYTWVASSGNRTEQLYRINHSGGQSRMTVDHRQVGNGWVYLGTYHFNSGSSAAAGSVQISNLSGAGGSVVIADAIRFGNGMGDVPSGQAGIGSGSVSGYPREDENSLMWLWRAVGQSSTFSTPSTVIGTSNVSAPIRMAEHMNSNSNPYGSSVYVSFHSNATTGNPDTATSRGAIGLVSSSDPTPNQAALAAAMGRQLNVDMRALDGEFETNWSARTAYTLAGGFGEITDARAQSEFDATIVEVAFHDNTLDAQLLRDPKVRDQLARSTYEATLEHLVNFNGTTAKPVNVTLPSPPQHVAAVSQAAGEVTITWSAGPSSAGGFNGVFGSPADGFRIYASANGYGFDGGTYVAGASQNSLTLSGYDATRPYYFKVVAENAGGQSLASEVLTALPSGGAEQVLIVNGYDRIDRSQNFKLLFLSSTATTDRVWTRFNNSRDYTVQVHEAIAAARPGIHVASTSNEAVISGAIDLTNYHSVIWISGRESTADHTLDATEQTLIEQFLAAGGNLLITGSELGYDLDGQNKGRNFFRTTLGTSYVADNANTHSVTAAATGIFDGLPSFSFSDGASFSSLDGQLYDVASPDVLSPQSGARAALMYQGGQGGVAAVQKTGTAGQGSLVVFGFPFETINDPSLRSAVMDNVLNFFAIQPPVIEYPRVVDVIVASSGWNAAVIDLVDGQGVAAGNGLGLSLIGGEQLKHLTWSTIDRVYVVFDRDVAGSFTSENVALVGTKIADYAPLLQIAYGQAGSWVGTLELAEPLQNDSLILSLSEAIIDTQGNALDGEWSDAVSTRSGNGAGGGQFNFRIHSLPGDVDQSGGVNVSDVLAVNALRGVIPTQLDEARADIDRSGGINVTDVLLVNSYRGTTLPASPAPHVFTSAAAAPQLLAQLLPQPEPVPSLPTLALSKTPQPTLDQPTTSQPLLEQSATSQPLLEQSAISLPSQASSSERVLNEPFPLAVSSPLAVIDQRVCRSPSSQEHQQALEQLGYMPNFIKESNLRDRKLYWVELVADTLRVP